MKRIRLCAMLVAVFFMSLPAHAQDDTPGNVFKVGLGQLSGFTQYEISWSGPDSPYYIRSLLEFPLHNIMIGGKYTFPAARNLIIGAEAWVNLSGHAGLLRDSDWIGDDGHEGLDIYSESQTDLNRAFLWNIDAAFTLPEQSKPLSLHGKIGLQSQYFDFTASDVNQVGYGPYAADYTGSVAGPVIDYSVTYTLPYLGLETAYTREKFNALLETRFSPLVFASDVDDHLLRDKLSKGTSQGLAWLIRGSARYQLTDDANLDASLSYTSIRTQGTQDQYYYYADGSTKPLGSVDQFLESRQWLGRLGMSYRF